MHPRFGAMTFGLALVFVCPHLSAAEMRLASGMDRALQPRIGTGDLVEATGACSDFLRKSAAEFNPGYDADLLVSEVWSKGLHDGLRQFGNTASAYVPWRFVRERGRRDERQEEIRKTVFRWGAFLCRLAHGKRTVLDGLDCEGKNGDSILRLTRIAFLLNEISVFGTDSEDDPNAIATEYGSMLQAADDHEALAIRALTLRYFAQSDPTGGDLIGKRSNGIKWMDIIGIAMSEDNAEKPSFQSLPTTCIRLAQLRGHIEKVVVGISKLDETDLDRYETGTYSSKDGFVEDSSLAAKRTGLSEWYEDARDSVDALICANAHKAFRDFPYEMLECYAKDLFSQMRIESRPVFVELLDQIDSRHSKESGLRHEYVQRKKIRHGEQAPPAAALTPDPGRLAPYAVTDALKPELARYGLSAGMYKQAASNEPGRTNELSYLLFKPKGGGRQVPLVLFVPGSGELGSDLTRQFRQRTIFEKVTSPEFQKKHPCYLLVIAPPEDAPDLCRRTADWKPGRFQRPFLSALACIAQAQKAPAVDMDRIYATGLSYGGRSIYGLSFVAPHLFAACAPVSSGVFSPDDVREERPGNWYHLYNEGDYARHPDSIPRLEAFAARVRELGGEFRVGTYPAEGHNAWDAAWREDALWDWMFSHTLSEGSAGPKAAAAPKPLEAVCTASKAGLDEKRGPERAADGLEGTAYVSAAPMGPGDWLQCEFKEPFTGKLRVKTGHADGTMRLSRGHVEVSANGKLWTRAATVSQKNGEAAFQQREPIRFLRLLPEPRSPETLVLREIVAE